MGIGPLKEQRRRDRTPTRALQEKSRLRQLRQHNLERRRALNSDQRSATQHSLKATRSLACATAVYPALLPRGVRALMMEAVSSISAMKVDTPRDCGKRTHG
eukprot:1735460-Pleurochrysis_carterae.AAC.3